jgi:hypothetical protein
MANLQVFSMAEAGGNWAKGIVIQAQGDTNENDNAATIAVGAEDITLTAQTRYLGISIANSATELAKISYAWQIKNNRVDSDGWITIENATTNSIILKSSDLMSKHNEVRCYASYKGSLLSDTIEIIDENWPEEDEWITNLTYNKDANKVSIELNSDPIKKVFA